MAWGKCLVIAYLDHYNGQKHGCSETPVTVGTLLPCSCSRQPKEKVQQPV